MNEPLPTNTTGALPPLYAMWMEQPLGGPIPGETEATCSNCVMLRTGSDDREGELVGFFSPPSVLIEDRLNWMLMS